MIFSPKDKIMLTPEWAAHIAHMTRACQSF
jgi:hypothetical protein